MKRHAIGAVAALAVSLAGCAAIQQQVSNQEVAAIEDSLKEAQLAPLPALAKLHFMEGTWRCVVHGGPGNGYVSKLTYSFTPDGLYMIESERGPAKNPRAWSMQMWGYDVLHKSFDAYQFTPAGIFTKTIQGWQDGKFVSTRDDNQATVSIRPRSKHAFDWLIQAPDKSSTVIEACTR